MRDLTSPISPVHDYEPLLNPSSSEKGDRGFTAPAGEWDQAPKFRHRETHTLLASLGLNVLLLLSIAYLAVKQSQSIEWKGARPVYTPARDAVVHELVKFASVGHAKSPFDGPPTPEVDDAWKDLYVAGISAIPKSSAALLPNRTEAYTGDEMHYIVELDIFHQLHCLNLVRKSVWREFYPEVEKDRFTPTGDGKPFDHVDHCLNAIRESLTCNADLTPVTWHWNEKNQISSFDFDAVHTCVNWDMIHKWTKENTARVKFDFHHHVVDDLHFPDDPKAK